MVYSDIYHHTGRFKKLPSSPKPKPQPQLAELQPYFVFNPPPPPPRPPVRASKFKTAAQPNFQLLPQLAWLSKQSQRWIAPLI